MLTRGKPARGRAADDKDALPAKPFVPGLNPPLTGGVTFGKVVPGGAAFVRVQEERDAVAAIVLREELTATLRNAVRRVEDRFEVSEELATLFADLRAATMTVCERIAQWKRQFPKNKPRAFTWNGLNYLITLPSSLDFLDRSSAIVKWFGFRCRRNPFLVPAFGTPDEMLPIPCRRQLDAVEMSLLREMEQLIINEEKADHILDTTEQCSWCSVETAQTTRAMCRPCREYYCYTCIGGNLGPAGCREAKKSTAWVCFVCTWDERQRMARDALKEARRLQMKPLREARLREEIRLKLEMRAAKFGHEALDVTALADHIPTGPPRRKHAPPPVRKPRRRKSTPTAPQDVQPVRLAPDMPAGQFVMGFNLSAPFDPRTSQRLRDIALRLHRPRSVWWTYLDSTGGSMADAHAGAGSGTGAGAGVGAATASDEGGHVSATLGDTAALASAFGSSALSVPRSQSLPLSVATIELCITAPQPHRPWQRDVLSAVPYLVSADMAYQRAGAAQWVQECRQRRRLLAMRLHMDSAGGDSNALLRGSVRPWEERKRTQVDVLGSGGVRFTVERRMGTRLDLPVLWSATLMEQRVPLPEYQHEVDACSVVAMDDGDRGPLSRDVARQLWDDQVRQAQRQHLQAQVDAAPEDFDPDVDLDAVIDEAAAAEVPDEVQEVLDWMMDRVAPLSEAEDAAVYVVDHILNQAITQSYEFDSEQVANAMMDYLIDRATNGHFRAPPTAWHVEVTDVRGGRQWHLQVPIANIKAEAGALHHLYGGVDDRDGDTDTADTDGTDRRQPFWWREALQRQREEAEAAAAAVAVASPTADASDPSTPPAAKEFATKAQSEADMAKRRIQEARQRSQAQRAAALNQYGVSSDEGSDSDASTSSTLSTDSSGSTASSASTASTTSTRRDRRRQRRAARDAWHARHAALYQDIKHEYSLLSRPVPPSFRVAMSVCGDVIDSLVEGAVACSDARRYGKALFTNAMRQWEVLMDRVALVPVGFPTLPPRRRACSVAALSTSWPASPHPLQQDSLFSEPSSTMDDGVGSGSGPLSHATRHRFSVVDEAPAMALQLGLSVVEQRRYVRLWETPREAAESVLMAEEERLKRAYDAHVAAVAAREAEERRLMALEDDAGAALRGLPDDDDIADGT